MALPVATYARPARDNLRNVPADLGSFDSWIVWREEPPRSAGAKPGKIPVNPLTLANASTANPASWAPQVAAIASFESDERLAGVGFVFSESDPFTGLDLDDCRDPKTGALEPWASELIRHIDSYTEVSPSQRGVKIFVRAKIAGKRNHFQVEGHEVEVYDRRRYFAVTGERVEGAPVTVN